MLKKLTLICSAIILITIFTACKNLSINAPTKSQIKEDLSQEESVVESIDNTGLFSIESIDIELADTESDIYKADIIIHLENQVYSVQRKATVTYKHYDVGGWVYEDISHIKAEESNIIGPYLETCAINTAKYTYDNVKLISHETNLNQKTDEFTFTSTYEGKFFDYTITFVDTYSATDGSWKHTDRKVTSSDNKLHLIDGLYYFGISEHGKVIHFNNDSTVTLLSEDDTEELTLTPTLNFYPNDLSCSMQLGGYSFTITQDAIKYGENTLSKICFFERKWLRESFYNTCMEFLNEDQNRHSGEHSSDLSSSITRKELYGQWIKNDPPFRYVFEISDTEVSFNYPLSFRSETKFAKTRFPKDLLFYGYEAERQAYIVYFCERKYTTHDFYVDKVHTLEFIKKSNGTVVLNKYYHDW